MLTYTANDFWVNHACMDANRRRLRIPTIKVLWIRQHHEKLPCYKANYIGTTREAKPTDIKHHSLLRLLC
jgi:hypothetical protein